MEIEKIFLYILGIAIIFIITLLIFSFNPRVKNFDINFKVYDIELQTKANFEIQKEKVTDFNQ